MHQLIQRNVVNLYLRNARIWAGSQCHFFRGFLQTVRPDSVVGIATGYGLDGPGIESRWGGAIFSVPVQTGPRALPSLLYNGYRVFPGGKERPGREADPSPPSSAVVKNG